MGTHTFATLEIPAPAWDAIRDAIKAAGPEYLQRYLHDAETIHFAGSEVGLVRLPRRPGSAKVISDALFRNSVLNRDGCDQLAAKVVTNLRRRNLV